MARYAISRERTLRGLGRTFYFQPRLRGFGDDVSPPDVSSLSPDLVPPGAIPIAQPAAPPPIETTMIEAPSTLGPPPSFFSFPAPTVPAPTITPVVAPTIAPTLAPSAPLQLPSIVFPSQGPVRPPAPPAPTTSWLDQQMIAGFPNKYLALLTVGGVLLLSVLNAKKGRR